jgi:hypothetical protein
MRPYTDEPERLQWLRNAEAVSGESNTLPPHSKSFDDLIFLNK